MAVLLTTSMNSLKEKTGKNRRRFLIPSLFAISGLICWCGISQVISNSVSSAFQNAFHIPPIVTTVILVLLAAVIILQKNATIKLLDILVPIMAGSFFAITVFIILLNVRQLPAVFARIFSEAFGLRQAVSGGLGAVIMNGIKRGLFSNEAGSGSAPCAAAAAEGNDPSRTGLIQALGVLIDTIVICSCTAMIMLLVPEEITAGLSGMDLLQTAMYHHLGSVRCDLYRHHAGIIQFFHIYRNPVLCTLQHRLPAWGSVVLADSL